MSIKPDGDRFARIEALQAAARVERSRTLLRLLKSLFRPRGEGRIRPVEPVLSGCG